MSIEHLLNGGQPAATGETLETPPNNEPPIAGDPPGGSETGDGGTPPPGSNGTHVPLSALEAERKTRQDWKERASRAEAELEVLRRQGSQPQTPPPQLDPLQQFQQQIINERFNTSEALVRDKHGDAEVEAALAVFQEAAKADPSLQMALQTNPHPWKFMFEKAQAIKMQREVGTDPKAYREKLRAEILAEIQQGQPPAQPLPQSLNGARSVAPRNAGTWTGPTPLGSILK